MGVRGLYWTLSEVEMVRWRESKLEAEIGSFIGFPTIREPRIPLNLPLAR